MPHQPHRRPVPIHRPVHSDDLCLGDGAHGGAPRIGGGAAPGQPAGGRGGAGHPGAGIYSLIY